MRRFSSEKKPSVQNQNNGKNGEESSSNNGEKNTNWVKKGGAIIGTIAAPLLTFSLNKELQKNQQDLQEYSSISASENENEERFEHFLNSPDILTTLSPLQEYEYKYSNENLMEKEIKVVEIKIQEIESYLDKNTRLRAQLKASSVNSRLNYREKMVKKNQLLDKIERSRKKILAVRDYYQAVHYTRLELHQKAISKLEDAKNNWENWRTLETTAFSDQVGSLNNRKIYMGILGNLALVYSRCADATNNYLEKNNYFRKAYRIYGEIRSEYSDMELKKIEYLKDKNIMINHVTFLRKVYHNLTCSEEIIIDGRKDYPDDIAVLNAHALFLCDKGQFDEARDVMVHALKLEPENPMLVNNLSYILVNLAKNKDELHFALRHSKDVVKKWPKSNDFLFNRGVAYLRCGKYEKAQNDFQNVLKGLGLETEKAYVRYLLGVTFTHLGHFNLAKDEFEKASNITTEIKVDDPSPLFGMDEYILDKNSFASLLEQRKIELNFTATQEKNSSSRLSFLWPSFDREGVIRKYREDTNTDNVLGVNSLNDSNTNVQKKF